MEAKTKHSSSSLLIILLIVLTFPIWIGIVGGIFGLAIGLFTGALGVVTGLFGVIMSIIMIPFHLLFGWGDGDCDGFPLFHHHGLRILAIVAVIALLLNNRRKRS